MEKDPTRAFSWLKATTTAFTFKTLLRHYAKRALTPRSLNVKLGLRHNYHKGRAAIRHYANQVRAVAGGVAAGPRRAGDLAGVEPAEPRGAPLPHPRPSHPPRVDQPRHQPRPLGRQPAVGLLRKFS